MPAKTARKSTAEKFRPGDRVCMLRPRPMGTHRTMTWIMSGGVVGRIGEDTYRIKDRSSQFRERH